MEKATTHLAVGLGLSLLFLILALGLPHWSCGSILHSCLNLPAQKAPYQIVGALLVCATLVNFVAFAFSIAGCANSRSWATPVALALTWLGGILALAAIAYYFAKLDSTYCPLLAVIGMTFTLTMAISTSITPIHEVRGSRKNAVGE
ncbi:unnamed protein product [Dibothriocephalus latus]|uniref:MARVEL domain-containing protein n=1 Tax=Dibothriocephalus latus TaxID=60516 RepID=A0A3P7PSF7_DIBLA|nr:unnamed protein product [Dibothriocephalus latus]